MSHGEATPKRTKRKWPHSRVRQLVNTCLCDASINKSSKKQKGNVVETHAAHSNKCSQGGHNIP